ncbi:MFS transporter [Nocardia sp. NPDC005998]|uniref:MFS transporter n=1 Tax=Nocardia sp. NPDC005998 TaxID=3156894 RepID=UPI0033A8CB11
MAEQIVHTNRAPRQGAAPVILDDPRRRRSVLVGVCLALMAVVASVSGLNVAQPQIALEFGASLSTVIWIINVYTVSLAALLLPLGAIGDRWGRKPVLLTGLAVFGIANLAAALAPTAEILLATRLASGVGAAMIMPVTLAVITSTFPDEERSRAIGVWTGVAGGGGILGMFLSAALVDVASWRWLFVLPILLVVAATVVTLRSVPDSREDAQHDFDTVGSLLSMVAVVGLILVLDEGPVRGWTAPVTLVSLLVAVVGVTGFVTWELRRQVPLLDVRLFRDRGLASGSAALLVVFGVQAGIFVVVFPYLQAVLGWSGLRSTLALLPTMLVMMIASGLAPRVAAHIGSRSTMAAGIVVGAAGVALMAGLVSVDGGYLSILPGMLAMGLGMGVTMTPATEAITSSLPRERQGVASALNDVTRELGTALGVALLGAILAIGYRSAIEPRLDGIPADVAGTARQGIANAVAAADTAGPQSQAVIHAAQQSFVTGWQQAMWVGAGVLAVVLVYVLVRGPERTLPRGAATAGTPGSAPSSADAVPAPPNPTADGSQKIS